MNGNFFSYVPKFPKKKDPAFKLFRKIASSVTHANVCKYCLCSSVLLKN